MESSPPSAPCDEKEAAQALTLARPSEGFACGRWAVVEDDGGTSAVSSLPTGRGGDKWGKDLDEDRPCAEGEEEDERGLLARGVPWVSGHGSWVTVDTSTKDSLSLEDMKREFAMVFGRRLSLGEEGAERLRDVVGYAAPTSGYSSLSNSAKLFRSPIAVIVASPSIWVLEEAGGVEFFEVTWHSACSWLDWVGEI